jgi:site-specific DNA-methyltransferase (adenine-specific)
MQFLKGDCLEVMKTLPSKSIDCFVCDLPYGCLSVAKATYTEDGVRVPTGECDWDIKIDLYKFWKEIRRLCKNDHTPILMFCTTKFGAELIASNPDWFRYDLIWYKPSGVGFLNANKQPLRSHELIYVFSKKGAYYKRIDEEVEGAKEGIRCVKSVIEIANKKGKGNHPTQKPEELYEWLLKRYCIEGGTILDPTAGSFTSCFTANKLGLKSIGIELSDEFYDKALKIKDEL